MKNQPIFQSLKIQFVLAMYKTESESILSNLLTNNIKLPNEKIVSVSI